MSTAPAQQIAIAGTRGSDALALLLIIPAPVVGVLAGLVFFPGPVGSVIYSLCKLWMALLPAFWWLMIDRRTPSWSPPRRGGFMVAGVLGLAMSAAIVAAYLLIGVHLIDNEQVRAAAAQNHLNTVAGFLVISLYIIVVNSVMEEYVYRWFVFRKFERFMPGWAAVLAAAGAFTIHHIFAIQAQMGWRVAIIANIGVFIGGATWSWLYLRYQSVWPAYLSHAIVDIAILAIGARIIFG